MMIKIMLINKHPVVRQGMVSVLESCSEFKVVGDAESVTDAIPQIGRLKPDVVLMDMVSGTGYGNDIFEDIRSVFKEYPKTEVFLLTDSDKEYDFLRAVGAGVRGYLSKTSEVDQIIDAIRLVVTTGVIVYSSKVAELFDLSAQGKSKIDQLSEREKEILRLVARGASNKEIARQCYISEATVKAYMKRIAEKMNVKNRAEAVASAIEKGVIGFGVPNSDL